MKVFAEIKTSVKVEIEFSTLEQFFKEHQALYDPGKESKIRDTISNLLYDGNVDLLKLYDKYKESSITPLPDPIT